MESTGPQWYRPAICLEGAELAGFAAWLAPASRVLTHSQIRLLQPRRNKPLWYQRSKYSIDWLQVRAQQRCNIHSSLFFPAAIQEGGAVSFFSSSSSESLSQSLPSLPFCFGRWSVAARTFPGSIGFDTAPDRITTIKSINQ